MDHTPDGTTPIDEAKFASIGKILLIAGPLVLSQMGVMLMQIVDGIFLSRYSQDTIAAVGPAGMSFWLVCGLFIGLVGYTSTFVAQYVGAKRPERVGAAVWQGIYLAILAGLILILCGLAARPYFDLVRHAPSIRANEVVYFQIHCWAGPVFMLSATISGFYAGRNDNLTLMVAHIAGGLTNAILDYLLIFGHFGLPEMGMAGAAYATVTGVFLQVLILGILLFKPSFRREFGIWQSRAIDLTLMLRMIRYGFPNGVRYVVEIAAWTVFLLIVGRIDSLGLAASNIAWRINGMAFFPVIGLSIAVSMLVGQAQGARRPDLSRKVTLRGLLIGQTWMAAAALVMVVWPDLLLRMFFEEIRTAQQQPIYDMTVKLLWFVATYSLVDNFNIILMSMLAGAGDTRWMLIASVAIHGAFLLAIAILAFIGVGTYTLWLAATILVFMAAILWIIRFRSGRWRTMQVIEHSPIDVITPAFPGPNATEG